MCQWFKLQNRIPVTASWGHFLGRTFRSLSGTTTPSMLPNKVESPKQRSMTKKRTDQIGEPGILVMASVNTMKARPVPSTPYTNTHQSRLKKQKIIVGVLEFYQYCHLTEKFLHVTDFEVQSKNSSRIRCVVMVQGCFIVTCSDAVFRKVKCIW